MNSVPGRKADPNPEAPVVPELAGLPPEEREQLWARATEQAGLGSDRPSPVVISLVILSVPLLVLSTELFKLMLYQAFGAALPLPLLRVAAFFGPCAVFARLSWSSPGGACDATCGESPPNSATGVATT